MERQDLIEITIKIYKITLLFPKKEPLREKIRETAGNILENFILLESAGGKEKSLLGLEMERNIDVLDGYLEIAKWQNWTSYFDILKLKNDYVKIKNSLGRIEPQSKPVKKASVEPVLPANEKKLNPRQEKILDILKKKEMVQVWEVNKILPNVSKRTLRRDFEQLLKDQLVDRVGEKNQTYYKLRT